MSDPERYQSYLLRLWKEAPDLPWRYQVRCVATGEEHRFSEFDQVLAFLQSVSGGESSGQPAVAGSGLELAYV
jgi:hypothetical protein